MPNSPTAVARVLAMVALIDGELTDGEMQMLGELHAFDRIQITPEEFREIANDFSSGIGHRLSQAPFLSLNDVGFVDEVIAQVSDADLRRTTIRLAAAMLTADGRVSSAERLIFDHMLVRWGYSHDDVHRVIREDQSLLADPT